MAASVYNEDNLQAIKAAIDGIEELIPTLKKGVDNCVDICRESGSAELNKTADGVSAGVGNQIESMKELVEDLNALLKYYEKLQRAMGN